MSAVAYFNCVRVYRGPENLRSHSSSVPPTWWCWLSVSSIWKTWRVAVPCLIWCPVMTSSGRFLTFVACVYTVKHTRVPLWHLLCVIHLSTASVCKIEDAGLRRTQCYISFKWPSCRLCNVFSIQTEESTGQRQSQCFLTATVNSDLRHTSRGVDK